MPISVKKCLIFTFWIFNTIWSKDLAFYLAESFFASENYEAAITEYKRFIFFNSHNESVNYAYYKIGISYGYQKKWREAIDALKYSIQSAPNESIKNEREIALAIVLLANRNYNDAEFRLLKVESFTKFSSLKQKAAFFRGIACIYSYKWKEARKAFRSILGRDSLYFSFYHIVDSLLSLAEQIKYKSSKLAKIFSTILPGSGQIYAGDIRNGLNSLLINILTFYLLINGIIKKDIKNIFFVCPLFQRYYLGNRFHAEKIAEDYNNKLNKRWVKKILKIFKINYE